MSYQMSYQAQKNGISDRSRRQETRYSTPKPFKQVLKADKTATYRHESDATG